MTDDIAWLTVSADSFLTHAVSELDAGTSELTVNKRLRNQLSASRANLVVQQAALRIRARKKFACADQMFFTSQALEQSTSEIIARYKSEAFSTLMQSGQRDANPMGMFDLCCGIGGDCLFATPDLQKTAVDHDPLVSHFAQANSDRLISRTKVQCCDVTQLKFDERSIIHIDPDRRAQTKTTTIEHFQPSTEFLENLISYGFPLAIKLAPATTVPTHWHSQANFQWIGHQRECKQQIAWFNWDRSTDPLYATPTKRIATILANNDSAVIDQFIAVINEKDVPPQIANVHQFVYEPHSAILASNLQHQLARHHELSRITNGNCYLTSDVQIMRPALAAFEVLSILPFKPLAVTSELKRLGGRLREIKYRGIHQNDAQPFRKIKCDGPIPLTLILTPSQTNHLALLTRKLTSPSALQAVKQNAI